MTKDAIHAAAAAAVKAAKREHGRGWSRVSVDARRGAIAAHVVAAVEAYGDGVSGADVAAILRRAWTDERLEAPR
jgi:hypothetical protein